MSGRTRKYCLLGLEPLEDRRLLAGAAAPGANMPSTADHDDDSYASPPAHSAREEYPASPSSAAAGASSRPGGATADADRASYAYPRAYPAHADPQAQFAVLAQALRASPAAAPAEVGGETPPAALAVPTAGPTPVPASLSRLDPLPPAPVPQPSAPPPEEAPDEEEEDAGPIEAAAPAEPGPPAGAEAPPSPQLGGVAEEARPADLAALAATAERFLKRLDEQLAGGLLGADTSLARWLTLALLATASAELLRWLNGRRPDLSLEELATAGAGGPSLRRRGRSSSSSSGGADRP